MRTAGREFIWPAARDKVVTGESPGTHLKHAPMVGGTIGVLRAQKTPILAAVTHARSSSDVVPATTFKGG